MYPFSTNATKRDHDLRIVPGLEGRKPAVIPSVFFAVPVCRYLDAHDAALGAYARDTTPCMLPAAAICSPIMSTLSVPFSVHDPGRTRCRRCRAPCKPCHLSTVGRFTLADARLSETVASIPRPYILSKYDVATATRASRRQVDAVAWFNPSQATGEDLSSPSLSPSL